MSKLPWKTPPERTALNKRLRDEDRYEAYGEVRDGLKLKGLTDKMAWQVAAMQFLPLNGDPLEFTPEQTAIDLFEQMGPTDTPNPPAAVRVTKNFKRFPKGGTEETQDKLMPPEKRWSKVEELAVLVDMKKTSSPLDDVQWAYSRRSTPWNLIDPEEVPSQGALALLAHIKASPANYAEFIRTVWAKTIPERKYIDAAARFLDDGRKQFSMLDKLAAEFADDAGSEAAGPADSGPAVVEGLGRDDAVGEPELLPDLSAVVSGSGEE